MKFSQKTCERQILRKITHQNRNQYKTMWPSTTFQSTWRTISFGTKFSPKNLNGKNFEKTKVKFEKKVIAINPLYQISVNLENLSFWDHICLKTFHGGVLRQTQPGDNFFPARKCYKMASFRWFQVDSGWF